MVNDVSSELRRRATINGMLSVSPLLLVSRRHVDYGRMDSMLCQAR
ncbi:hypothetical protein [Haloactinopolyspora alba]|nr:hypothetical protein [Haloactinopolyspora alba]